MRKTWTSLMLLRENLYFQLPHEWQFHLSQLSIAKQKKYGADLYNSQTTDIYFS